MCGQRTRGAIRVFQTEVWVDEGRVFVRSNTPTLAVTLLADMEDLRMVEYAQVTTAQLGRAGRATVSRSMYPERLSATAMAATLSRALAEGVLGSPDDAGVFYDLSRLDDVLDALRTSFPPTTLHAVAVKANQTVEILKRIRATGQGAEVASMGELQLALAAGFPVEAIVFD